MPRLIAFCDACSTHLDLGPRRQNGVEEAQAGQGCTAHTGFVFFHQEMSLRCVLTLAVRSKYDLRLIRKAKLRQGSSRQVSSDDGSGPS